MKINKKMAVFLCMALICGFLVLPVQAATFMNCGDADGKITVQSYKDKYSAKWTKIIDKSIAAWNGSSANVNISVSAQSKNVIKAKRYNDTWYGLTTQTHNKTSGYTSKFIIKVNTKTIKAKATNYSKFARSTVTHEFGHVFWLADNPNTKKSSIMKYDRDRNTMVKPQQFDIDNVNKKYK